MLARIAQELFWLGRDLTRAEHTARILDGAFHADVSGVPGEGGITLSWEGVLATIGAKPPAPGEEETEVPDRRLGRIEVARMLTLDTDSPASVVACVARARERGRGMRDVISTEMWEALNSFYLDLGRYDLPAALQTGPYSFYQDVKERCALFWGLLDRTMLRDEGRAFLEAGRRIEEADMVLRMLRVAIPVGSLDDDRPAHETEALALLHAVGGLQAFRRAVRIAPSVLADAQPRSSPPVLRLDRLIADLELQRRAPEAGGPLEDMLERVQDELARVDSDIDARYFAIAALAAVHL
jgi:uncharacterized alpha-E superfamily protein